VSEAAIGECLLSDTELDTMKSYLVSQRNSQTFLNMNPLITTNQLRALLNSGANVLICDCRFDLAQVSAGREAYAEGHIPGAIYIDLDTDLSGTKTGKNGRHPLPTPDDWASTRQRLGIAPDSHVIAYDSQGSAFASRLWWMLRATGHDKAQVLDGGLESWKGRISNAIHAPAPLEIKPKPVPYQGLILVDAILNNLASQRKTVIDARSPDRFHGQNETLDPVAGHIPDSLNRFFKNNLEGSEFKSPEILRKEYSELLGNSQPSDVIHSCGSGVTACVNLLAMEQAGLGGSLLYAGSWSEWCADPERPVER
jgi:thiosulfate/3-mercaptopyruvate sulfurtransferase